MTALMADVRYALRGIRRSPGFALVVVLTLALGIGANTTIFSLINAVLLRPPAGVTDPGRLVAVSTVGHCAGGCLGTSSYPDYLDFAAYDSRLTGLAAFEPRPFTLSAGDETFQAFGEYASPDYFGVLGVTPALGRTFRPEDGVPGATPVAVIGHGLWQQRFGGQRDVIGRTVRVRGAAVTIVGVAPAGFIGTLTGIGVGLWVPFAARTVLEPGSASDLTDRGNHSLFLVGRLAASATAAEVQARFDVLTPQMQSAHPEWQGHRGPGSRIAVASEREAALLAPMRTVVVSFFGVLAAVAALVLLICCANLANLLLARGSTRARDIGVRLALGASRSRVVRQMLTESVLLALAGGIGGVLLATAAGSLIVRIQLPLPVPVALDLSLDWRVFGFAAVVAAVTGIVFGVLPALRFTAAGVVQRLHGDAAGERPQRRRFTLRDALVVSQVAVSAILLIVAGLFVNSLRHAQDLDLGFDPDHVAMATVDLDSQGYPTERMLQFYQQLETRARALPGVGSATLAAYAPLGLDYSSVSVQIEDYQPGPHEDNMAGVNRVDDEYFTTLGIPVLQGRGFTAQDRMDTPRAAVVNQAFVRRYWPDGKALGRHIACCGGPAEVVGVVPDAKMRSLGEGPTPYLYLPLRQNPVGSAVLEVRTAGDPSAMLPMLRSTISGIDPDLPVQLSTMHGYLGIAMVPQRLGAILLSVFGGLGMLLAALGLYGVLAYLVARRTREIGIRMALGSEPAAVMHMVLWQALRLVAAGLAIGLLLGLLAGHLIRGFLFGVGAGDPATFAGVLLIFTLVTLVAGYGPARRATRVDPVRALRSE